MSDKDLQTIANDLKQLLLNQTSCRAGEDVVRDHTAKLSRIETNLEHILAGVVEINKRLDAQEVNHNANSERLTKIETQKSTVLGVASVLGAVIGTGLTLAISATPLLSKIAKLLG